MPRIGFGSDVNVILAELACASSGFCGFDKTNTATLLAKLCNEMMGGAEKSNTGCQNCFHKTRVVPKPNKFYKAEFCESEVSQRFDFVEGISQQCSMCPRLRLVVRDFPVETTPLKRTRGRGLKALAR